MSPSWIAQPGKSVRGSQQASKSSRPADSRRGTSSQTADAGATEQTKVKLNYMAASWEKVLRDLAEDTGSTLIADRVPAGRFTRRDGATYSRSDAVRIINHEIEPLGFRLLEKGEYLIVLDMPSQRPRYQAPVVPKPTSESPRTDTYDPPAPLHQRKVTEIYPVPRQATDDGSTSTRRSGIHLASHEESATGNRPAAAASRPEEPLSQYVFRTQHQSANELARLTFRLFKDRAELVEAGRNDLPTLRVRQTKAAGSPVVFSMAVDEEHNELLIDAPPKTARSLLTLLRRLDAADQQETPLQLVSSTRVVCEVAPQLSGELNKLRALAAKDAGRRGDAVAQVNAQEPPPPGDNAARQTSVQEAVGNIKAEVSIEAIPDLGVLILKGNEADVERVMQLIKELERLSETTAPKVHLLYLKHVNSSALAELLTTVFESLTKFPGKATQPRQNVAIVPVVSPNSILIVAPESDLEGILELADQLDVPIDANTEFEVFPLKSGVALRVAEKLTALLEEPEGLGARVVIQADERSNSLIVRGNARDLDTIAKLVAKVDREATETTSSMKVFRLHNAVATEMAAILNAAIQSVLSPPSNQGASQIFGNQSGFGAGGQIAQEFRDVRSTVLKFIASDANGERILKSGILADIRISPDPRMNSLIVTAPEASLGLIGELIRALDQPTDMVAEIKVFTLANADATVMVQQLQGLFNAQVTGGTGQAAQQRQQIGVQIADAQDASSGLIPLKFSIDTRTNSVIAIGSADALRVVEAIMLRLDESDVRARKNAIFRLKNTPAANIAQSVATFLTNQQNLAQQDPNLFSTVEQLEREVIVVAEPVSNNLLISATPRYYDEVIKLIEQLDAAPQQVIMQALIVEVLLEDTDEFGVELGFQDSVLFNRSILDTPVTINKVVQNANGQQLQDQVVISQSATPGYLFGNPSTPLGNNVGVGNSSKVGSQGLSNFSLGRVNGDLGFGGLVLSASSESVSMLLRALAQNRQVRVLSRPQVRAMDNQVAFIQQGQIVPVVNGVANANSLAGANPQIQRENAGVILQVTPRISPDGNIVMAIRAEKSQFQLGAGSGVPIFTDATTGNVITAPIQDISVAQTTISVPNGQTVVLGGLITSRTDQIHRRVPWLGDIPVLGWAFRYDFVKTQRTELLIFLTPRIISDDAYSEHIKEVEMARIHFVECEAEELHGPLRGIPTEGLFEGQVPGPSGFQPMPGTPLTPGLEPPPSPAVVPTPQPTLQAPPIPAEFPQPQSLQIQDPQLQPVEGAETTSGMDRRVIHAAMGQPNRPNSLRIDKSSAAAADGASEVKLGKNTVPQKKSWFSFSRKN